MCHFQVVFPSRVLLAYRCVSGAFANHGLLYVLYQLYQPGAVECEVCESQSGPRGDQGSVRIQFIHDQWQTQWTLGEYYGSVRTRMSPGAEVNVCLGSCKFGVL